MYNERIGRSKVEQKVDKLVEFSALHSASIIPPQLVPMIQPHVLVIADDGLWTDKGFAVAIHLFADGAKFLLLMAECL